MQSNGYKIDRASKQVMVWHRPTQQYLSYFSFCQIGAEPTDSVRTIMDLVEKKRKEFLEDCFR